VHTSPPVSIAEWYFAPVWRSSSPLTENCDPDVPTKHCASAAEELTPGFIMSDQTGDGGRALKVRVSGIGHSHDWECYIA